MKTNTATLKKANWSKLRMEVNERIDVVAEMVKGMEPNPANDKFCVELIVPAISLLADFCTRIKIEPQPDKPNGND